MIAAGMKACLENERNAVLQYDGHRQDLAQYVHDRKESLFNLKQNNADMLVNDQKCIRDMECLMLEAGKMEK